MGGWLGYFLGGSDGLIVALIIFVVMDYASAVMCAINYLIFKKNLRDTFVQHLNSHIFFFRIASYLSFVL